MHGQWPCVLHGQGHVPRSLVPKDRDMLQLHERQSCLHAARSSGQSADTIASAEGKMQHADAPSGSDSRHRV